MQRDTTTLHTAPALQRCSWTRGCAVQDITDSSVALLRSSRYMSPISALAHATQRAAAPRAHPPPWAGSPGRFRASPASPGDGSVASVVSRRFHCVHFKPMAVLQESTPHPPRNFSFSVLKLTDCDNQRGSFPKLPHKWGRIILPY